MTIRHRALLLAIALFYVSFWALAMWFFSLPSGAGSFQSEAVPPFLTTVVALLTAFAPFTPEWGMWEEAQVSDGRPAWEVYKN